MRTTFSKNVTALSIFGQIAAKIFGQDGDLERGQEKTARRDANQARLAPVTVMTSIHEVLIQHGYKLIDDAWSEPARRTYDHNDEANREFIASLAKVLAIAGWETHPNILRSFRRPITEEILELEPGGSETIGHLIHHMKSFD